jgi:hypothetical protein
MVMELLALSLDIPGIDGGGPSLINGAREQFVGDLPPEYQYAIMAVFEQHAKAGVVHGDSHADNIGRRMYAQFDVLLLDWACAVKLQRPARTSVRDVHAIVAHSMLHLTETTDLANVAGTPFGDRMALSLEGCGALPLSGADLRSRLEAAFPRPATADAARALLGAWTSAACATPRPGHSKLDKEVLVRVHVQLRCLATAAHVPPAQRWPPPAMQPLWGMCMNLGPEVIT